MGGNKFVKPNIATRGRVARAVSGAVCVLAGAALLWAGWPATMVLRWILGLVVILVGGFQLFEAKRGWCAIRACGIRTPV